MAVDYAKCAKEICDIVGGKANLVSAAHCATRLRLVTVDNSKIDMKKIPDIFIEEPLYGKMLTRSAILRL